LGSEEEGKPHEELHTGFPGGSLALPVNKYDFINSTVLESANFPDGSAKN